MKLKFGEFELFLFLIYETSFYLVTGQTLNKGKSDCTKLYNFIKGDSQDYSNSCCLNEVGINCDDEDYITVVKINELFNQTPDLTSFPYLSRIEELYIDKFGLKEIPNSIFSLSSLKKLSIYKNNIELIPPAIQNLSQLQELYLHNNNIKVVPPEIHNLSQLERLDIGYNDIKELPNEIFNLINLKQLSLSNNTIEVIPPAIQYLSKLDTLYLSNNNIKELPYEIFKLTNLKRFDLDNNPNLKTKMIKFGYGNSVIEKCYFQNITVSCYEPGTCEAIHLNDITLNGHNTENVFKKCTQEEIDEILIKNINKNKTVLVIILGCIVFVLIGILVTFMLIRKNKSKNNNSDFNSSDEFSSLSIKVLKINNKYEINNIANVGVNNNNSNNSSDIKNYNNGNSNDNNNNNSNDNNNNNNNNSNNDNNSNNTKNKLNQSNIANTNGHKSTILPVGVVLMSDPQNPGNYVMSSVPIFIDNDQNKKRESLNMHETVPFYNKKSNNMTINDNNNNKYLYCPSILEEDELPPEYSETDTAYSEI